MSHAIEVTDEEYQILLSAAQERGQTPRELLAALVDELRDREREPHHYETDDWLRHLGVSEQEIEASKQRVRDEAELPYDADA